MVGPLSHKRKRYLQKKNHKRGGILKSQLMNARIKRWKTGQALLIAERNLRIATIRYEATLKLPTRYEATLKLPEGFDL